MENTELLICGRSLMNALYEEDLEDDFVAVKSFENLVNKIAHLNQLNHSMVADFILPRNDAKAVEITNQFKKIASVYELRQNLPAYLEPTQNSLTNYLAAEVFHEIPIMVEGWSGFSSWKKVETTVAESQTVLHDKVIILVKQLLGKAIQSELEQILSKIYREAGLRADIKVFACLAPVLKQKLHKQLNELAMDVQNLIRPAGENIAVPIVVAESVADRFGLQRV